MTVIVLSGSNHEIFDSEVFFDLILGLGGCEIQGDFRDEDVHEQCFMTWIIVVSVLRRQGEDRGPGIAERRGVVAMN